ncbi:MAG: tellurite resistance TerB family protein [Parvibaculum sp.]|uniref:tellurite resistance TerB family protein n=1 Tax=Parvibaculum sp. TaxID=2024848 RepID=UPI003C734693
MSTIAPETALIYVMVTMSAVDRAMSDNELRTIGDIVKQAPAFRKFDTERLIPIARECASILQEDGGLDAVFGLVKDALPPHLRETAYALAVEIASADLAVGQEEIRLLQLLRDALDIEKLVAAAIERGARARHMTV